METVNLVQYNTGIFDQKTVEKQTVWDGKNTMEVKLKAKDEKLKKIKINVIFVTK